MTVATTDLVSGADTIGWNNLKITTGGHLNGTGGQWTGIAKPGPGGHFPQGANPQPGTSLSPAVTMATGDAGTRDAFTHDGSTAVEHPRGDAHRLLQRHPPVHDHRLIP
ncbi:hypothetical protein ACF087_23310 [Streptomyces goshikiensis]|uniref:hypothetical protein n=1 Tax=Streptomyces goshikiensis TaxID=1942 RepID=UPI0036F6011B